MEPLQPGDPTVLGGYSLIARLGAGGMGWVFLGRTRGGRTVAVKAIRAELAQDPEFRERFRHEVDAARAVAGPFTASVLDADPDAPMPWLATTFIAGLSLRDVVNDGWRLPESSLRVLASGLAEALTEIHRAHLVHRDLKPSNVMVTVDGPRVIDFGISRAVDDVALTRTGVLVGSPGFMSPEQIRGRALTPASDVFALGSVLAYAATGHNPFGEGPDHVMLYRVVHGEPDLDDVPPSLARLVTACLAKEPDERPRPEEILDVTRGAPTGGSWLPAALTAVIARRATEILDYEDSAATEVLEQSREPGPNHDQDHGSGPNTAEMDPPTRVLPLPTDTRIISRERIAEPVPYEEPGRNRTGVYLMAIVLALIAIGLTIAAALLSHHTSTPPPPVTTKAVTTAPQSSAAPQTSSSPSSLPSSSVTTSPSTTPTTRPTSSSTPTTSPTTAPTSSSSSATPSSSATTSPSSSSTPHSAPTSPSPSSTGP